MPSRLSVYLGSTLAVMACLYIALVVGTVFLANWQTELASSVSDTEASIGSLESKYYAAIAGMNKEDAAALGFVVPSKKVYARTVAAPTFTFASGQ